MARFDVYFSPYSCPDRLKTDCDEYLRLPIIEKKGHVVLCFNSFVFFLDHQEI